MVALTNLGLIPLLAGFSGLVITVYLFWSFERESAGTTRMGEIAGYIQEGANAFIKRR